MTNFEPYRRDRGVLGWLLDRPLVFFPVMYGLCAGPALVAYLIERLGP